MSSLAAAKRSERVAVARGHAVPDATLGAWRGRVAAAVAGVLLAVVVVRLVLGAEAALLAQTVAGAAVADVPLAGVAADADGEGISPLIAEFYPLFHIKFTSLNYLNPQPAHLN